LARRWLGSGFGRSGGRSEGSADGAAPVVGAEGVDVFALGELDGLQQGLAEIGEGGGGFWFDFPLGDSGEEAAQGGAEIAGREIAAGQERGYIAANLLGGEGSGFPFGMEAAEMRVAVEARRAAAAAIGEGESTQARAIGAHGSLQKRRIYVVGESRRRRGVLLYDHSIPES
jgi:hypothetical protein